MKKEEDLMECIFDKTMATMNWKENGLVRSF